MDGCAATVAQFQMAGDKVGVEMSEKDVADLQSQFLGVGQVLLNIAWGSTIIAVELRSSPSR